MTHLLQSFPSFMYNWDLGLYILFSVKNREEKESKLRETLFSMPMFLKQYNTIDLSYSLFQSSPYLREAFLEKSRRQWDFGRTGKRAWESPCRKRATSIMAPDLLSSSHSLSFSLCAILSLPDLKTMAISCCWASSLEAEMTKWIIMEETQWEKAWESVL